MDRNDHLAQIDSRIAALGAVADRLAAEEEGVTTVDIIAPLTKLTITLATAVRDLLDAAAD
ncbi:MAG: hypothetical protein QM621_14925 [Aeromicrobium sp.]|uniref:hypothetical protein n=1 Tax=Aeromicrobium sp. TaxID=1871063 RepID=UPI0039E4DE89